MSVRDKSICGSFYALKFDNGVVCYSGSVVGSIAIYFCIECSYSMTKSVTPLIRTCGEDGQWNGTSAKCQCGKNKICLNPLISVIF